MVVGEYKRLHDGPPSELFIHPKSAPTDEEWRGFAAGCDDETNLVGMQIADVRDDLKLYRPGGHPVRGGVQREGEVVHLVALRVVDLSRDLASVGQRRAASAERQGLDDRASG